MIFLALGLIGFGVADLVRWSPDDEATPLRAGAAAVSGATAVGLVAALSGMAPAGVILAGVLSLAVLGLWVGYELIASDARSEYVLGLLIATLAGLVAASGQADPVGGDIAAWYGNLDFGFVHTVPVGQFLLGVGATLFLLATGNRIVRFTLAATESPADKGEDALRGGRLLGPMERLLVAASIIAGGFAGAGFVIAAKGLLRFRELTQPAGRPKVDSITEYFLIGTFTSVLVAGVCSLFVLAAS